MPLPIVAIIGRPNVGKSSLFNKILRRQEAVTFPEPGVTRDRKYAKGEWNGKEFIIVDTGGIDLSSGQPTVVSEKGDIEKETKNQIFLQVKIALIEANLILFMVDSRDGITSIDRTISDFLRKKNKPVIFVVNKVDNKEQEESTCDFYKSGWEKIHFVSSAHGRNVSELLDDVVLLLPEVSESPDSEEASTVKIAVIGKPNVGKSSLVNSILGENRVIVSNFPGTTRDSIDTVFDYKGKKYLFIDTAGLKTKNKIKDELEKMISWKTITSINRCDIALLLIDAIEGPGIQDMKIADLLISTGKACIFLVNKWDLVKDGNEVQENYKKYILEKFDYFSFASIIFISAKTGLAVNKILEKIPVIYYNYCKKVSTKALNKLLQDIRKKVNPPVKKGKRVKLKYITQVGTRPPAFFISATGDLPEGYLRYIKKRIYEEFDFSGTPLIVKVGKN